jgi:hypothetical protein
MASTYNPASMANLSVCFPRQNDRQGAETSEGCSRFIYLTVHQSMFYQSNVNLHMHDHRPISGQKFKTLFSGTFLIYDELSRPSLVSAWIKEHIYWTFRKKLQWTKPSKGDPAAAHANIQANCSSIFKKNDLCLFGLARSPRLSSRRARRWPIGIGQVDSGAGRFKALSKPSLVSE